MEDPCSSQEESRPEPITLTKFYQSGKSFYHFKGRDKKTWKEARHGEMHSHPPETLDICCLALLSYRYNRIPWRERTLISKYCKVIREQSQETIYPDLGPDSTYYALFSSPPGRVSSGSALRPGMQGAWWEGKEDGSHEARVPCEQRIG